jgi:hypothetical protein
MSAADPWRAAVETMRERAAVLRARARGLRIESCAPRPRSDDNDDARDPFALAIQADAEAATIEAMADVIAARLDG